MDNEQVEVRKAKLKKISEKVKAYPERYETTHKLSEVASLEDGTQNVSIAGRILAKRGHGKMAFIVSRIRKSVPVFTLLDLENPNSKTGHDSIPYCLLK